MNIIIMTTVKHATGGARQAVYQGQELQRAGHRVTMIGYPGTEMRSISPELNWVDFTPKLPVMRRVIQGLIRSGEGNVLHAFHGKGVKYAAYLGTLWRLQGLPVVCAAHRGVTSRPHNPLPYLLPGIRAYMVNSKETGDLLPLFWRRKRCHFVGNAIPPGRTQTSRTPEQILAELDLEPGRFIFGDVAHDKPEKGVGRLLEAYARARTGLPPSNLLIVGVSADKWAPLCRELGIEREVRLIPRTEHVADYVQVFSLFVFPSYFIESQPNVIMEAMQLSKPVIGSNLGNIPELIGRDFCFKAGDANEISEKMIWAAQNPALLAQAAEANLAYSRRFSLEQRTQTVLGIYRDILREAGLPAD
ncbi:MAG: glycosyltransferase family 4 protein [Deltaproteobacteria bacterium]|nr:glycosyltransferase family 4 protein [Deltaproteobacteria bacterium]